MNSENQIDLLGMPIATPKRTNDRPEAGVLVEVMAALRSSSAVAWVQRQNTGALKVGGRFIRFGWPGCSDVIGQLRDGRFLAVECKASKGRASAEQSLFLAQVNQAGGVAFIAKNCRDVFAKLGGEHMS